MATPSTLTRLRDARAQLVAALDRGGLPPWLREAAAGCLNEIDAALVPSASAQHVDRLIAQAETLASASRSVG